ncbi:hypothetical protein BDW72DRAFT_213877 [Aspergillus terricola var. indicus]
MDWGQNCNSGCSYLAALVDTNSQTADREACRREIEATPLLQKTTTISSARDCWQHQQLLRCILKLKQTISKTTGLFKTEYVHEFTNLDPIARQSAVEGRPGSNPSSEKLYGQDGEWTWTRNRMPPLDFWEDCFRHQKMAVWNEGSPLQLTSQCIDSGSLTYSYGKLARDNHDDSETLSIECFRCLKQTAVPWTTRRGKGLADNGFLQACQWCKSVLRRDALLIQKLRRDLQLLLEENIPLPGTCWNIEGEHGTLTSNKAITELVRQLPGKLLLEVRPTNLFLDMTQIIEASAKAVGSQFLSMLHKIFGHYQYMGNSSCDLQSAVMRVSKSTSSMQNTESRYINFLQGHSKWLLSRRHALLNMNLMDPLILFWSTHLLAPRSYCDFFRNFGNGELVDWEPPHDSATCNLCHTLCFTSLSEWKEWISTV